MATTHEGDHKWVGAVTFAGTIATRFARSQLAQEPLAVYPVTLTDLRVHDAIQTNLPGTAATDDLAIKGGTFGTDSLSIQSSDGKATSITQRARFQYQLPPEYEAAATVVLRLSAGMNTTISDGTATVDVECYRADRDTGVGSDICATSATTINSLTFADKDFTITAATLGPGDVLDVRATIAITDSATATAVIGEIGAIEFLLDIRG